MEQFYLNLYTDELSLHARVALREYDELLSLLNSDETKQHREVWVRLQSFLVHAGIISKLLYPVGKKRGEDNDSSEQRRMRGIEIREYLGLGDDHPIKNRIARNALEHIDEKIDLWVIEGRGGLIEAVFDTREAFEYLSEVSFVRRVIILDEMIFLSQGEKHEETNLSVLQNAVTEILTLCEGKLKEASNVITA